MLDDYVQRLVHYKSHEKKGSLYSDDNNLIGYLEIIKELIKSKPTCMTADESHALANEIITSCLFTLGITPLAENITKSTDIAASEKDQLNKC